MRIGFEKKGGKSVDCSMLLSLKKNTTLATMATMQARQQTIHRVVPYGGGFNTGVIGQRLTGLFEDNSIVTYTSPVVSGSSGSTGTIGTCVGAVMGAYELFISLDGTIVCSSLKRTMNVIVPDGVIRIEPNVFNADNNIQSIILPSSLTTIGSYAFRNALLFKTINLPSSLTSIGVGAFFGCSNLEGPLTIPSGITILNDTVFQSCRKLNSITLPETLTAIEFSVFRFCIGLTSLTLPASLLTIGSNAFASCSGLTGSLYIPNNVTSINTGAFINTGYTSVSIPAGVTLGGSYAQVFGTATVTVR